MVNESGRGMQTDEAVSDAGSDFVDVLDLTSQRFVEPDQCRQLKPEEWNRLARSAQC